MSLSYIWNLGSSFEHDSVYVYQSIHITWSVSSHSVYMHPHCSAAVCSRDLSQLRNEPPPKLFPWSKYFEIGFMEAIALKIPSMKSFM